MQTHIGKAIRMSEILSNRSLILDTTIASCLGATPYLEDLTKILQECNILFDGIIINPGQMEHLAQYLGGKNGAAPLVRIDWTNAYRDENFCLPVSEIRRVEISQAEDVMQLGGSSGIATLLMGFGDDFEAENVHSISRLIRASYELSLPIFVDIRPIGYKVSEINLEDTIKLGVSFMMEAGADALIIPQCSLDTLNLIGNWSTIPIIVRTDRLIEKNKLEQIFNQKIKGVLFSEKILEIVDFNEKISHLKKLIKSA